MTSLDMTLWFLAKLFIKSLIGVLTSKIIKPLIKSRNLIFYITKSFIIIQIKKNIVECFNIWTKLSSPKLFISLISTKSLKFAQIKCKSYNYLCYYVVQNLQYTIMHIIYLCYLFVYIILLYQRCIAAWHNLL